MFSDPVFPSFSGRTYRGTCPSTGRLARRCRALGRGSTARLSVWWCYLYKAHTGLLLFVLMIGRTTIKSGYPVFFKMGVRLGWNDYT